MRARTVPTSSLAMASAACARARGALASSLVVAGLVGCVELPTVAGPADAIARDGSVLAFDAGPRRPATAEGSPAAGCGLSSPAGASCSAPDGEPGAGGAAPSSDPVATAPRPRAPSDLVITEIMSNPSLVRDDQGEWIELWNASDAVSFDLAGCAIEDGAAPRAITEPLRVAPRAFVTLARGEAAGFAPDRVLALSLANEADAVALTCEGVLIDRVAYGPGFPLAAGVSMALDPGAFDATANDAAEAWCLSPVGSYAEQGTPGAPNAPCHGDRDAGS